MLTDPGSTSVVDSPVEIKNFEVSEEELPAFEDMPFEHIEELPLEHPGAKDPEYRKRRDYIASLARNFRESGRITDVEYTDEEQGVWQFVAAELEELHQKHASPFYLKAKKNLGIRNDRIPQLTEMNRRLKELTGFRLAPIEGLVNTRSFLTWLSWRTMLSTQYIRHHSKPGYTPEPDIVHEAMGHIPMFTNEAFADYSQFIGLGARMATDEQIEQLGRLYWFTIEFGLVEAEGEIKAYGAGVLSSFKEMKHAFSSDVELREFDLEKVINHEYTYSDIQPVLYVVPSYQFLKDETRRFIETFSN